MIFRPVQFFNLLLLLLGQFVLFFIESVQKHQKHTGQQSHHDYRICRVKERMSRRIPRHKFRKVKGYIIAEQCLGCTEHEKNSLPPSCLGNADINKAEHKPFRHSAVEPACREKTHREQQKKQDRNGSSPCNNTFLLNTDLRDHKYSSKADCKQQPVHESSAHRQYKDQCDHADACNHTKHTLLQADPMVKDDLKPFFEHAVFPPKL